MLRYSPPSARASALVNRMNVTERTMLLSGIWGLGWGPPSHPYVGNTQAIPRLGVPWLSLQDGPQGYRDGRYGHYPGPPGLPVGTATQWPSGLTVGATWDVSLAGEWGVAMGKEFRGKGANVQLGVRVLALPSIPLQPVNPPTALLTTYAAAGSQCCTGAERWAQLRIPVGRGPPPRC